MSKPKDKMIEVREIVYCQDEEKSFGDVFIYEPENVEEQNLGNLFIVGELKDLPRNCSYIMNILASKIKKEFYSNTKRTAEEGLEAGLSEANKTLADLAEQGNGEYVSKLSMVCGTYRDNKFYLSQIGKIKSLLVRGGQIVEIVRVDGRKAASPKRAFNNIASGELSDGDLVMFATSGLFNIFSLEQLKQLGNSMKLNEFAAKLQEDIEEEDSETVSLLLIEIEGAKKTLIKRSEMVMEKDKETAEESLDKALKEGIEMDEEDAPAEIPVAPALAASGAEATLQTALEEEEIAEEPETAALAEEEEKEPETEAESVVSAEPEPEIVAAAEKVQEEEKKEESAPQSEAPQSMEIEVVDEETEEDKEAEKAKEEETASIKAAVAAGSFTKKDSGKISLSDIIREYEKMESRNMPPVTETGEKEKNIEEMIAKKETASFEDLDEEKESVSQKLAVKAKGVVGSLTESVSRAALGSKLKGVVMGEKEYKVERGKKKLFSGSRKTLAAVLVIVLILGGYSYYSSRKKEEKRVAILDSYETLLDQSREKMEEAEMAVISGSEDNAGKLYLEARALALRVRDEYDVLDTQAGEIINQVQAEIDKIDKVAKADDAFVIANFDNDNIKNLVEVGGTYYVLDGTGKKLYKVNTETKELVETKEAKDARGSLLFVKNLQSVELLLSDGSQFMSYGLKNGKLDPLEAGADVDFVDFATYGRYVYLLSPSDNQIYKYQKSTGGLDGKVAWLKDADISKAVSIAIDQYIYVLSSDGQIRKYYTGEEFVDKDGNKFAVKQPLDPLGSPTRIYTSTDQENLYVLEPSKHRVVIFDKETGAFEKQIVHPDFAEARDFFVDSEEKNMAVLVKGKIMNIYLAE